MFWIAAALVLAVFVFMAAVGLMRAVLEDAYREAEDAKMVPRSAFLDRRQAAGEERDAGVGLGPGAGTFTGNKPTSGDGS